MDEDLGIDLRPSVEVLAPYRDDIRSAIASALTNIRHELRFITLTDEGRRPGIDYSA